MCIYRDTLTKVERVIVKCDLKRKLKFTHDRINISFLLKLTKNTLYYYTYFTCIFREGPVDSLT